MEPEVQKFKFLGFDQHKYLIRAALYSLSI